MEQESKLTEQEMDLAHHKFKQRNVDRKKELSHQVQDSLAARLRNGDRTAAIELVDTCYEQIYLFMRRLGHDHQISEDLTQESFLNAWHHIGQLRDGKALNSWLYHIAINVSKLYWRKHKGSKAVGIELTNMPDSSKFEGDKVEHYEQLEQLKNAVERLPGKLKQTVVLHYMQQLTIFEAAEAAGIREGTFKSRLNRALKALRNKII